MTWSIIYYNERVRKEVLAKPSVKKAFDALAEEYTALHTMLDARQATGLTQTDMATIRAQVLTCFP